MNIQYILNKIKGILSPRSRCDEYALLNAAVRGNADGVLQILGSSNPDMHLADGSTLLINVAISQFMNSEARLEVLKALHRSGATIDLPKSNGVTALMLSTGGGEECFCEALIDLGASIRRADSNGDTVLIWAASTNKLPSLQFLIRRGANVRHQNKHKRTAMMYAARQGNVGYLRELLDAGADARLLDRNGMSALAAACSMGKREAAVLLSEQAPDLRSKLTIHLAAAAGFEDIVSERLKDRSSLSAKNENQFTPLELAVIYNQRSIVEQLLPYYDDIPLVKGLSLAAAAMNNFVDLMELLLEKGADPNIADEVGDTPLILAAGKNNAKAVELLLKSGADPSKKNLDQDDAQDVAQANRAYDALQLIFSLRTVYPPKN